MKILKGDLYWANLNPTIGDEISKIRPVFVISNDISNEYSSTVTILPVTSVKTDKIYPFEVYLEKSESNLKANSKIKTNQIRTIDKSRLLEKIGNLSISKIKEVEKALLIHLDIS